MIVRTPGGKEFSVDRKREKVTPESFIERYAIAALEEKLVEAQALAQTAPNYRTREKVARMERRLDRLRLGL
jgi:hypothetical protein